MYNNDIYARNVNYNGKTGCILIDGISASSGYNKYNIICSEQRFGSNITNVADGCILMPNYGIIFYVNSPYSGTGYPFINDGTNPMYISFSSVVNKGNMITTFVIPSINLVNNFVSARLYSYGNGTWNEIIINGLS